MCNTSNTSNYSDTFTGSNEDTFSVKTAVRELDVLCDNPCVGCIRASCKNCYFAEDKEEVQDVLVDYS